MFLADVRPIATGQRREFGDGVRVQQPHARNLGNPLHIGGLGKHVVLDHPTAATGVEVHEVHVTALCVDLFDAARDASQDAVERCPAIVVVMTALLLSTHWWMRDSNLADRWQAVPWWGRAVALATMIMSIALVPGDDRAFIYFQF